MIKEIPVEVVIAMISGLYVVLYDIWRKMARIEKNYVEHQICEKRREKCPCIENLKDLKEKIKKLET